MTMGLTEEERDLRDSVRGWAARTVTPAVLREAVEAKTEQRPQFWASLADLGVLGLHLPEEVGGAGCGLVELAVATEELGRVLLPGPYLPTVLLGAVLHDAGHTPALSGLADGSTLGAVALQPGTLRLVRDGGVVSLDGESGYVVGGQVGDLFLLAARDGDETVFVALARDRLDITDLPSHDLVRRNATAAVNAVELAESEVLQIDSQRVLDLAATLFAAEASGVADWAVTTAADYAKVRQQFGRPIGQFQGVKHTVARMLCRAEQARVCAWDAARATTPGTGAAEASLAAAVAGATALDAAFTVTRDCIQVLGGIGYTWEHDAHLYLRRAQSLRILLGSTASWRRRVARATIGGTRRLLGVDLPRKRKVSAPTCARTWCPPPP